MQFRNIAGQTFGRWTAEVRTGTDSRGEALWLVRCKCGSTAAVTGGNLRSGKSQSCGCLRDELATAVNTTHGHAPSHKTGPTPTYITWQAMVKRCTNPNGDNYKHYGGRGITVCADWLSGFEPFLRDMGVRPSRKYSIDRIDPDGNYEPGNCRWATRYEQQHNKRKQIA